MSNLQAIERNPMRRATPGSIEQQGFEYTRHGTVNVRLFLIVHSGRMKATCPAHKDATHYIQALQRFRQRHRHLRGVFLIQDGDPSHTAAATDDYFKGHPWWGDHASHRCTPPGSIKRNCSTDIIGRSLYSDAFSFHYLKRSRMIKNCTLG
jgi:hypothetical protein